ncbi:MAG TPA: hypothetical protein ENK77_03035 [Epsilonproteobacteria bacterium]|nr:hypothetical protein [Campylobacterota bacterium]
MFKKYAGYIGNILVLLSFYFIIKILLDNYQKIHIDFNLHTLIVIFIGIVGMWIGTIGISLGWYFQLKEKYPKITFLTSNFVVFFSQIGKYLPGNVGHFIGRGYMVKHIVSKSDIVYSLFVENIILLIVAVVFGAGYLFFVDINYYFNFYELLLVLLGIVLVSITGIYLIKKKISLYRLKPATVIKLFLLATLSTLFGGLVISLLAGLFDSTNSVSYLQYTAGFALAFLAGFVIPGAPGGIGIREYSFVLLFQNQLGESVALQIILLFRLISIVGDLSIFLAASLFKKSAFDHIGIDPHPLRKDTTKLY